jgi:hypothetical protein
MAQISTRLSRLEHVVLQRVEPIVRVFCHDELTPCREHARCDVELVTGTHYQDVIHLTFGDRE